MGLNNVGKPPMRHPLIANPPHQGSLKTSSRAYATPNRFQAAFGFPAQATARPTLFNTLP